MNVSEISHKFINNIKTYGLERYDPSDLCDGIIPVRYTTNNLVKFYRIFELISPLLLRKLLLINPKISPTTLFYLLVYHQKDISYIYDKSIGISSILSNLQAFGEYGCIHPHKLHGKAFTNVHTGLSYCAHNTSKIGIALCDCLKNENLQEFHNQFKSITKKYIFGLQNHHHWFEDLNQSSVSYYSNSRDKVINTSADVALFYQKYVNTNIDIDCEYIKLKINNIINFILNNANNDYSWNYSVNENDAIGNLPDCHHNAMILNSLLYLNHYNNHSFNDFLCKAISKFISNFINVDYISYFPFSKKYSPIVGYCETLILLKNLSSFPLADKIDYDITFLVKNVKDLIINTFYNKNNNTFASYNKFGININYNSIRWSYGPAFESLSL